MTPKNAQTLARTLMQGLEKRYEYHYTTEKQLSCVFKSDGENNPLSEKSLCDLLTQGKKFTRFGVPTLTSLFLVSHLFTDELEYEDEVEYLQALNWKIVDVLNMVHSSTDESQAIKSLNLDLNFQDYENSLHDVLNNIIRRTSIEYPNNEAVENALYRFIFAHTEPYWREKDFSSLKDTLINYYPEKLKDYDFLPEVACHLIKMKTPKLWGDDIEKSFVVAMDLQEFHYFYHLKNYSIKDYKTLLNIITDNLIDENLGLKFVGASYKPQVSSYAGLAVVLEHNSLFTEAHLKETIMACFSLVANNPDLAQFVNFKADTDEHEEGKEKVNQVLNTFLPKFFFKLHLDSTLSSKPDTTSTKFKI